MSEAEFESVMEAVRTAVVWGPVEDTLAKSPISGAPPKAINDNIGPPWPIIPFPDGSYVA